MSETYCIIDIGQSKSKGDEIERKGSWPQLSVVILEFFDKPGYKTSTGE